VGTACGIVEYQGDVDSYTGLECLQAGASQSWFRIIIFIPAHPERRIGSSKMYYQVPVGLLATGTRYIYYTPTVLHNSSS
jgi:hypothetical protein